MSKINSNFIEFILSNKRVRNIKYVVASDIKEFDCLPETMYVKKDSESSHSFVKKIAEATIFNTFEDAEKFWIRCEIHNIEDPYYIKEII